MGAWFRSLVILLIVTSVAYADDDPPPPDIQAILDKMIKREPLTAEESNAVIEWQAGAGKRARDKRMAGYKHAASNGPPPGVQIGDPDNATPTLNPSLDVTKRAKLTQATYTKLVKQILAKDKELLGKERTSAIEKVARAKKAPTSPLGPAALLALAGDGAGGLYATALAASRAPKSAITANALGVQLQTANLYAQSWDVLDYADGLAKDDATIQSNLGYAAMYLGDDKTATARFQRALQLDPDRPEPHLGLALIAKAKGDTSGALTAIRASIARGSSEIADQIVDTIAIQAEPTSGDSDPAHAARTPIGDDPGFKAGGGIVINLQATHRNEFPLWTPPSDPGQVAAFASVLGSWIIAHQGDSQKLHTQRIAARDAADAAMRSYLVAHSKDGVTIPLFDHRVVTVLDDYNLIYQARAREALKPFNEARAKGIKSTLSAAMTAKCGARAVLVRQLNASLGGAYAPAATKLKSVVEEYLRKTDPYIDSIWQADLQKSQQLQRRELVAQSLFNLRTGMSEWAGAIATIYCPGGGEETSSSSSKSSKSDPTEEATLTDPTPGTCPLPEGHKSLGVMSVDYSCKGFTIQGGEGVFGGLDVQFKGPSGHVEQKIFIGAGAEGDFGPVKGEGKAVLWVTKANGHIVDFGVDYGVSGSVEVAGQKAAGDFGLSASWRAGPNISGSGRATIFGTEYTGWSIGDK